MNSLIKIITEEVEKIFEIGEANAATYKYTKELRKGAVWYKFDTEDNDKYSVVIYKDVMLGNEVSAWIVEFSVINNPTNPKDTDFKAVVNKGRLFKVMSTITMIIKDFASEFNPEILAVIPSKSKGDTDTRRFKMYYQFIAKNIPSNYIVNEFPNENVIVIIKRDILADTRIVSKLKEVLKDKFRFANVNKLEGTREQMANLLRMHYGDRVK